MSFNRNEKSGLLFSFPALVIAFGFSIYPLIKTIIYAFSFTDEKGVIVERAGIENFYELFTDPSFYYSLLATLKFAVITVFFSIVISLFLAILCNEKIKGIGFFRTIFSSSLGVSIFYFPRVFSFHSADAFCSFTSLFYSDRFSLQKSSIQFSTIV